MICVEHIRVSFFVSFYKGIYAIIGRKKRRSECVETSLILCAVVIITCILTNKLTNRIGVPAVLVFMAIGMIFGSEGIFKIPFDNFG